MERFVFSMYEKFKWLSILCILACTSGCNDFVEEDLTDDTVIILAPADNLVTTSSGISFYWEKTVGALKYHLQVAKPSFTAITSIVVDTLVSGTSFTGLFTPGSYQWRIRAQNSSSNSPYITRSFQVDSTMDLSGQQVILLGPETDYADSLTSQMFNWYGLYNAAQYTWTLKNYTGTFSGTVALPSQTVTDTFITVSSIPEGRFEWGIRAENGFSNSNYVVRNIWIDMTDPGTPSLSSPSNGFVYTSNQFSFIWSRVNDTGSPLKDSVLIYSNASLTNLVKSLYTSGQTWSDTLSAGTYYWRVRTVDKAGNTSGYSSVRSFTVN